MRELVFDWQQLSIGYYVDIFGHASRLYYHDDQWKCLIDGKQKDSHNNLDNAKQYAETVIRKKITKRIKKAQQELELLTEPVFIVDHVGSSYGNGPTDPTVIVGHSCTDTKLFTRCTKVFVLGEVK